MAYDPMYQPTDEYLFDVVGRYLDYWKYSYPNAQEIMPRHMPEALGKYVVIKAYVDEYHARNMENSRSHFEIIIYVNNSPIICHSKLHNTVDSSSFR